MGTNKRKILITCTPIFDLIFISIFNLDSIVNGKGRILIDRNGASEESLRCIVSRSSSHLLSLRERYLILSLKDASSSSRRTKKEGQDDSREILFFSPSLRG